MTAEDEPAIVVMLCPGEDLRGLSLDRFPDSESDASETIWRVRAISSVPADDPLIVPLSDESPPGFRLVQPLMVLPQADDALLATFSVGVPGGRTAGSAKEFTLGDLQRDLILSRSGSLIDMDEWLKIARESCS
jgi:hypothetical protein